MTTVNVVLIAQAAEHRAGSPVARWINRRLSQGESSLRCRRDAPGQAQCLRNLGTLSSPWRILASPARLVPRLIPARVAECGEALEVTRRELGRRFPYLARPRTPEQLRQLEKRLRFAGTGSPGSTCCRGNGRVSRGRTAVNDATGRRLASS